MFSTVHITQCSRLFFFYFFTRNTSLVAFFYFWRLLNMNYHSLPIQSLGNVEIDEHQILQHLDWYTTFLKICSCETLKSIIILITKCIGGKTENQANTPELPFLGWPKKKRRKTKIRFICFREISKEKAKAWTKEKTSQKT